MFETLKKEAFKLSTITLSVLFITFIIYTSLVEKEFQISISKQKIKIETLILENKDLSLQKAYSQVNLTTCKSSIIKLNSNIESARIYSKKADRLAKLEILRLSDIIKTTIKVSSDECSDIKESLDSIYTIEFDSL